MKIITWNVYRHNQSLDAFCDNLIEQDPDVVTLQEFPEDKLDFLTEKLSGFSIVTGKQHFLKKDDSKSIRLTNVIASKKTVSDSQSIPHDPEGFDLPPRYRPQYRGLDLEFVWADVEYKNEHYRVFNAHLECVAPISVRLRRFAQMVDNFSDSRTNLIAGDFNSFHNPLTTLATAPLYGNTKISDLFKFERASFAKHFDLHNLQNPFKGTNTFRYFPGQYDYILLPKEKTYSDKARLVHPGGSDHHGLMLQF